MVGEAGLEPAMPLAPDLQSGGVTNFPTHPFMEQVTGVEPAYPVWRTGRLTIVLHLHINLAHPPRLELGS